MVAIELQHCDPSLHQSACEIGNGAGMVSMVMWFLVLLPQLYRNYARRSVDGLSVLWASANASASLCNLFFAFANALPIFSLVMAVYMPVLELAMLGQFFVFTSDKYSVMRRVQFAIMLGGFWLCIVLVGFLGGQEGRNVLQWLAVVLWSVECFPQLFLNVERRVATAQAPVSIAITSIGKTTDALGAMLLMMPTQTVVLAFFSSSLAWTNAIEVILLTLFNKWSAQQRDQSQPQQRSEREGAAMRPRLSSFLRVDLCMASAALCILGAELALITAAVCWRLGLIALVLPAACASVLGLHLVWWRRCAGGRRGEGIALSSHAETTAGAAVDAVVNEAADSTE